MLNNLKKELEATFKEDVSVYFDINPHDGLLETHDVNASLKEKAKVSNLHPYHLTNLLRPSKLCLAI